MVVPAEHGLEPLAVPAAPGDAIAWHRDMLHASDANRSSADRRGMVLVFADADVADFGARDRFALGPVS